jgi:glycosyltransferase involved in cell wall biosynthesis
MSKVKNGGLAQARSDLSISVAMATYNGARYIAEQLDSLSIQTLKPFELVVTDDGSTDTTLDILEAFAKTAPFPVRIFRNNARLGYADNFLRAGSLCVGDLIAFCDQDDVWLDTKLELCATEFTDPEVLLCVHSGELWKDGVQTGTKCPGYDRRQVFPPLTIYPLLSSYGFAMVIRRLLLTITDNRVRVPVDDPMAHDQWVWFLSSIFGKIVLIPDVLVLYRQHDVNLFGGAAAAPAYALVNVVAVRDHLIPARRERRAAVLLESISSLTSELWSLRAKAGAGFMYRCARINRSRSKLYRHRASFPYRAREFSTVLFNGGYSLGQRAARLGVRAALKDAFLGVLGLAKAITYLRLKDN